MRPVREIVGDLNKSKVKVPRDFIIGVKTKYLGLFRQAMLQLHKQGIVADPGWYDERELISALRITRDGMSEHGKVLNYTNANGRVDLSEEMLLYAAYQMESSEGSEGQLSVWDEVNWVSCSAKVSVARKIWLAVTLWNTVQGIDALFEELNYRNSKSVTYKHKRVTYVQGIFRNIQYEGNEAVAEVFAGGEHVLQGSYADVLWECIYNELELSKVITHRPEMNDPGLFLANITHGQERDLLPLLDRSDIVFEGTHGAWLTEWYNENVHSPRIGKGTFVTQIRNNWTEQISQGIADMLEGERIVGMSNAGFWVARPGENTDRGQFYLIGQYVIDSGTGEILEDSARVAGSCGEFVKADILERGVEDYGTDFELTGCPVYLDGYGEYYDIYQLNEPLALWGGTTVFKKHEAKLYTRIRNTMYFDDLYIRATKMSDNGSHGPVYYTPDMV